MLRAAAFSLLTASLLTGPLVTRPLEAQRVGASFHVSASGMPVRSPVVGMRFSARFPRSFFLHSAMRHEHPGAIFFPYWFPYDDTGDYEERYAEAAPPEPPPVVIQSSMAEHSPAEPKLIEVPGSADAATVKPLPPVIFVFKNGERLEARRFLLRTNELSISVDRQQRTIPLDTVDLDATLAANRERGIDLRIPADPNEISLSF